MPDQQIDIQELTDIYVCPGEDPNTWKICGIKQVTAVHVEVVKLKDNLPNKQVAEAWIRRICDVWIQNNE